MKVSKKASAIGNLLLTPTKSRMGNNLQSNTRTPAVPPVDASAYQTYTLSKTAWKSQSKRVRGCAVSIDLLRKDIRRFNLMYVISVYYYCKLKPNTLYSTSFVVSN